MIPNPVYNAGLDNNGLVITISKGQRGYLKLNIANIVYSESNWGKDDLEDITVGPYNTIFAIGQDGRIYEYILMRASYYLCLVVKILEPKRIISSAIWIVVDSKNNLYAIDVKTQLFKYFHQQYLLI